jgi:hypothetical protein
MPFAASSSTVSNRDERVFTAAFGLMDSSHDGEAVAAFMRAREILHRHGSGFRRLLERSHEADQLNDELGRQNAQLLRENAALRARDSRPVSPTPAASARKLLALPHLFGHWDSGLIVIIAVWAGFGLLGVATALSLVAAILIGAAFTNWFSPIRFFVGALLALAAFRTGSPQPVTLPPSTHSLAATTTPLPQIYAGTAAPATPPAPADAAPLHQRDPSSPFTQTSAELPLRTPAAGDSSRLASADPRTRQVTSAKSDCGPHRPQPGFNCPRSNPWHSSSDFGPPQSMRSE